MTWSYKSPQSFPATFLGVLRRAAASPGDPIVLRSFHYYYEAEEVAEQFRHFRWCIRQEPNAAHELSAILEDFQIRTKLERDIVGFILYVTAKPTKISEFIRLNPKLADAILPYVNA